MIHICENPRRSPLTRLLEALAHARWLVSRLRKPAKS